MSTLDLSLDKDSLNKSLGLSLGLHVLVFIIFTIKTVFFAGEPLSYESVIKVDMVALPDKIDAQPMPISPVEPATATETKPEVAPTPVPPIPKLAIKEPKKELDPEAVNLDVTKKKQSVALAKLKQLAALEAIENDVRDDAKKKSAEKIKPIKGNAISTGAELSGVSRLQHDNYLAQVERHVRQYWALPEWLARKNLQAQIRVRFDENGNLISRDIYKSSGNPSFDEVVIATIEKSSPMPPPPNKFVRILNAEGILLGFPE